MSNEYRHFELLTGDVRRRRWTTEQKLTIIEQSFEPGETASSTARRHGVAPNLLYRRRRHLSEGGAAAVDSDEPVVGNSEVKKLEDRVRELERMLGRKTMEVEISAKPYPKRTQKNGYRGRSCCRRTVRDEGRRRHAGRLPFKPHRAAERQNKGAWAIPQGRGCRASARRRLVDQRSGWLETAGPPTSSERVLPSVSILRRPFVQGMVLAMNGGRAAACDRLAAWSSHTTRGACFGAITTLLQTRNRRTVAMLYRTFNCDIAYERALSQCWLLAGGRSR